MQPPPPIEYATPSPRPRVPQWALTAGPLVLFVVGAVAYAGSRWLRAKGLTSRDALLTLRTALEGVSPLILAAGVMWGIAAVAAPRTRKAAPLLGLLLCAGGLAFVVYHVFRSVKQ